jgi:hypothetical protein
MAHVSEDYGVPAADAVTDVGYVRPARSASSVFTARSGPHPLAAPVVAPGRGVECDNTDPPPARMRLCATGA